MAIVNRLLEKDKLIYKQSNAVKSLSEDKDSKYFDDLEIGLFKRDAELYYWTNKKWGQSKNIYRVMSGFEHDGFLLIASKLSKDWVKTLLFEKFGEEVPLCFVTNLGEKKAKNKVKADEEEKKEIPTVYKEVKTKPRHIPEEEMTELENKAEEASDSVKSLFTLMSRFHNEITDVDNAAKAMRKDVEEKIRELKEGRGYTELKKKLEDTSRQLGLIAGVMDTAKRIAFRIGGVLGIVEKKVEKIPVELTETEKLEKVFIFLGEKYPDIKTAIEKHLKAVENGKQALATVAEELDIYVGIPTRRKSNIEKTGQGELDELLENIEIMVEDLGGIEEELYGIV